MKLFSVLRLAAVFTLLCTLSLGATAQTPLPLSSIFNNKAELGIESVQNAARAQMPTTPYYKSNGEETVWFEGYFRAASNSSKLALLSDDGTSVWIDGQQVLNRAGQTQGFEGEGEHRRGDLVWRNGFDVTFYPLAKTFVAGQVYHLKLHYTNTIHDSEVDVDGLSLWAYDGGGEIVEGSVLEAEVTLTFARDASTHKQNRKGNSQFDRAGQPYARHCCSRAGNSHTTSIPAGDEHLARHSGYVA